MTGTIFNIQHFSVHDGPGIRTVVFLKGCPLRCRWCGNPESQQAFPELAWTKEQCLHCGNCAVQTNGAIHFTADGKLAVPQIALSAEETERICPSEALHRIGEEWTVDAVLQEVQKDSVFYTQSGGGMTLSGGEPLAQPAFTKELLIRAKQAGLHCAIETTGYAPWPVVKEIARYLDYIFMDIKSLYPAAHRRQTGVDNRLILENFQRLVSTYPQKTIHVRTPVIPGFNDTDEDIRQIALFLAPYRHVKYELLQYHRFGVGKYETLGRTYDMPADAVISDQAMRHFTEIAETYRGGECIEA